MLQPKRSVLKEFVETDFEEETNTVRPKNQKCSFLDSFDEDIESLFPSEECGCGCRPKPCSPKPCPDPVPEPEIPNCANQVLAMAYVVNQELNIQTLYTAKKALQIGTLFAELNKPFKGGCNHEK